MDQLPEAGDIYCVNSYDPMISLFQSQIIILFTKIFENFTNISYMLQDYML